MEEDNSLVWKISTIVLAVLFVIALAFVAFFGFKISGYNKVKATEISNKLAAQEDSLKKQFQADKEQTLETYTAGDVYGNFSFKYPKVWSTNVTEEPGNAQSFTFLADPALIINNQNSVPVAALRVIYFNQNYDSRIKQFENAFQRADVTVSGIKGSRFTGTDRDTKKNVSFVLIPLRDKTIYIGTDDTKYLAEYQKILNTFVLNK